jgi:Spy/CpxP family protein refolding chaperone
MKKKILAVILFSLIITGYSYSQDRPPMHDKEGKKRNPEEMVKKEMNMLKSELDLTETQVTFIQKILDESSKKMQAQMESGSKDFDEMKKLMDEKDSKIQSVLTDEQLDKFKDLKKKRKDKFNTNDGPPPNDR